MSRPGLDWSIALGALLSYWRRHPGQALTLILGLALATALWTGVQAINAEARASYARASDAVRQTTLPSLVPRAGRHLPLDSYVALRRAGWQVAPRLEAQIEIAGKSYRLVGIDPLTAPAGPGLRPSNSGGLDGLIAFLTPPGQLLAHPGTLGSLGTPPGLPPARALPDLAPGLLLGDLSWISAYLGRPEQLSQLTVLPGQARDDAALAKIAPDLRWQPPREGNDLAGLTRSFHLNLTAFGLLAFAVGLFIAHGAVGLAFEQRRDLFRTLRALGVTAKGLSGLLAGEMALVALLAAGLGIAMG
ncbi:MAG: ABC transporter permease, partial [Mangrovicoccus sp.]|nr:ABC transporter permease [Mangrovicoccus sp.]